MTNLSRCALQRCNTTSTPTHTRRCSSRAVVAGELEPQLRVDAAPFPVVGPAGRSERNRRGRAGWPVGGRRCASSRTRGTPEGDGGIRACRGQGRRRAEPVGADPTRATAGRDEAASLIFSPASGPNAFSQLGGLRGTRDHRGLVHAASALDRSAVRVASFVRSEPVGALSRRRALWFKRR
jgi:hypothetical protein